MRIVVEGRGNARPLTIGERALLGSHRECDVSVEDRHVSRVHAQITRDESGTPHVRDCASRNGTRVNGEPLAVGQSRPLQAGDILAISSLQFRILEVSAARPMVVVRAGNHRREVFLQPGLHSLMEGPLGESPLGESSSIEGSPEAGPFAKVADSAEGLTVGFVNSPGAPARPWEDREVINARGHSFKLHLVGCYETQPSPALLKACSLKVSARGGNLSLELVDCTGRALRSMPVRTRMEQLLGLLAWLRLHDRGEKSKEDEGFATGPELCGALGLPCKADKQGRPTLNFLFELKRKLNALAASCFELEQPSLVAQRQDNEGTEEYRLLLPRIELQGDALALLESRFGPSATEWEDK